jgi:PE-PGRS family protein with aspartyl peptidase-like domain/uncharacterized protein DUF3443
MTVADDPDQNGKGLLVPISVNRSPPINVLLDTGSSGLRIFASALRHLSPGSRPLSANFGGELWSGHRASATISIGAVTAPHPIALQRVEALSCASSDAHCGGSKRMERSYTDRGIHGILGVGLRRDPGSDIYSPIAQLSSPLDEGFTIRTDGFGSTTAQLELGLPDSSGGTGVALKRAGRLPNGGPAWADDQVEICFRINHRATNPPCSPTVIDSGSNNDVVYAKNRLGRAVTKDGILAPGNVFEARHPSAFDLEFRIGAPATSSVDVVEVQSTEAMSILGIETFFRYDVQFDLVHGRIGLIERVGR